MVAGGSQVRRSARRICERVKRASARTRARATGGDDRERLAKLASTLGRERPVDRFFEAYWEEARRLLSQNWSSVERVAAALLEHGKLNGDRVDVLVL